MQRMRRKLVRARGAANTRRPVVVGLFLCVVVCLCAFSAVVAISRSSNSTRSSVGAIEADSKSLNFGAIWRCEDFKWTLPVQNKGDTTITVSRVEATCMCTSISPRAFILTPGERFDLHLTLDLSKQAPTGSLTAPAQFSEVVSAYGIGDDPRPIASWRIHGRVKNAFILEPAHLDFYGELSEGRAYVPKTIAVTCVEPCKRIDVSAGEEAPFAIRVEAIGIDQRRFQIHVAPKPTLSFGTYKSTMPVTAVLRSGERPPPLLARITAQVGRDIQALPSATHLGTTRVGTLREETINLVSRTRQSFDIESVRCPAPGVGIGELPQANPHSRAYRVTIQPAHDGDQEASVEFDTHPQNLPADRPAPSRYTVAVHLRYLAVK